MSITAYRCRRGRGGGEEASGGEEAREECEAVGRPHSGLRGGKGNVVGGGAAGGNSEAAKGGGCWASARRPSRLPVLSGGCRGRAAPLPAARAPRREHGPGSRRHSRRSCCCLVARSAPPCLKMASLLPQPGPQFSGSTKHRQGGCEEDPRGCCRRPSSSHSPAMQTAAQTTMAPLDCTARTRVGARHVPPTLLISGLPSTNQGPAPDSRGAACCGRPVNANHNNLRLLPSFRRRHSPARGRELETKAGEGEGGWCRPALPGLSLKGGLPAEGRASGAASLPRPAPLSCVSSFDCAPSTLAAAAAAAAAPSCRLCCTLGTKRYCICFAFQSKADNGTVGLEGRQTWPVESSFPIPPPLASGSELCNPLLPHWHVPSLYPGSCTMA